MHNNKQSKADNRCKVMLEVDQSNGKSNYDTWIVAIRMAEVTEFRENAAILADKNGREKWVKKLFLANQQQEQQEITTFQIISPTKASQGYYTPAKSQAGYDDMSAEDIKTQMCKEMIREACSLIADSISSSIMLQLAMGTESPWQRAIKRNDYDELMEIINNNYSAKKIFPYQALSDVLEGMLDMECNDLNLLQYYDAQAKEYYAIQHIYTQNRSWKSIVL